MKIEEIKNVMNTYKEAWEKQDPSLILECFTKKGIYQESPLAKPYKGHKEIEKFWKEIVVKNTKEIKFTIGKCYVSNDGKTGFAEWECINYQRAKYTNKFKRKYLNTWEKCKMVGIMILKMKGNKITHLNEYWKTKIE